MTLILKRIILSTLPLLYMDLIWLQSSYFDPESVSGLSTQLSMNVIMLIGICLELAHLFEFGILYLLIILALLSFGKLTRCKEVIAISISFLYGVSDEVHQIFVPYRSASVGDLLKNTIGIIAIWWVIQKSYKSNHSKFGRFLRKLSHSRL
jgi:polysaccharide biosynthesis protein VpsQ